MEQLYNTLGELNPQPVARVGGKPPSSSVPSTVIPPMCLGKASEQFSSSEVHVLLSDFGEVFLSSDKSRYELHAPLSVAAPETRFELEQGLFFSSDVLDSCMCYIGHPWEMALV